MFGEGAQLNLRKIRLRANFFRDLSSKFAYWTDGRKSNCERAARHPRGSSSAIATPRKEG